MTAPSSRLSRRRLLAAGAASLAALAGCSSGPESSGGSTDGGDAGAADVSGGTTPTPDSTATPTPTPGATTPWRSTELTDVLTGETFTIDGLGSPVVLETFAVWCSTCLRQQRRIAEMDRRDVAVVSLNVDPNEDAAKVKAHAEQHGFDWR